MADEQLPKPSRPIKSAVTVSLQVSTVEWLRAYCASSAQTQSEVVEWALLELKQREEPGR